MLSCKICGLDVKTNQSLSRHIKHHNISGEDYYIKYINPDNKCIVCGDKTKFIGLGKGFSKTCSRRCGQSTEESKDKRKKTMLLNYGVDNISKSDIFKEKKKQTSLKNYGVGHYLQKKENAEKVKQSNLKKYGVSCTLHTFENKKKKIDTWIEKYGVDHISKADSIKHKTKTTNIARYGNRCAANGAVADNGKLKKENTFIKKYGYKNTLIAGCAVRKNIDYILKAKQISNIKHKFKDYVTPLIRISNYNGVDNKNIYEFKCNFCKNIFKDHLDDGKTPRCLKCFKNNRSKLEIEIYEFISEYCNDAVHSNRTLIGPKEVDIYIPSKNIAVEFNGLYWHSESNGKDKYYHITKTNECKNKGVQLIHIFQDEWINKKDIVKSILLSKLGLITNKTGARNCTIKVPSNKEAKEFLNTNHIQGHINSKYKYGLYDKNDELVSLMTFSNSRYNKNYDYELMRFCNKLNMNVVGGFTRLLKHFIKTHNSTSIISYADIRYSNGNSYINNGFKLRHNSSPNYYYVKNNDIRESRISFQKHKLKDLLQIYDESLTEAENMRLNEYERIWDCGNFVFEYSTKGV
jgi:predicted nucleic acid-binding Zn ribbon protein